MSDLKSHVKMIADQIENGITVDTDDMGYYDTPYNEGDMLTAFDYLQDALDIEYIVDQKGNYKGARVLVAFGGPNIWIDTRSKRVEGYWAGDSWIEAYNTDAMGLDDALEELFNC